jgi:hypothetical protein
MIRQVFSSKIRLMPDGRARGEFFWAELSCSISGWG